MRDNIEKILALQGCDGYDAIGEILSLLAPVIEAAELWEKVEELAAYYHADRCAGCPERDAKTGWCSGRCSTADAIVKAFKEAPDGN